MEEGNGDRHLATGRFVELRPDKALSFDLGPVGSDGNALFSASHNVQLVRRNDHTRLSLTIQITDARRPEATTALAGMELGWNQLLDKLAEHLAGTPDPGASVA